MSSSTGTSTLAYWSIRGLAQPIRLLLEHTGTEYEDKLYKCGPAPEFDKSCWLNEKFSLGFDFPNLPYYITKCGIKITQSNAIMRHIGRTNDLCGQTEIERVRVDILENQSMDFRNRMYDLCYYSSDFEKLKPKYKEDLVGTLKQFSDFLGERKFFAGDLITFPDFMMYELLDIHKILVPSCLKNTPNLEVFVKRFEELPKIKAYMASDRFMKSPINNKYASFW